MEHQKHIEHDKQAKHDKLKKNILLDFHVPVLVVVAWIFIGGGLYYKMNNMDSEIADLKAGKEANALAIKNIEIREKAREVREEFICESLTEIKTTVKDTNDRIYEHIAGKN